MRVFSIVSIVIFSLGQAVAQDLPKDDDADKAPPAKATACYYSIAGRFYEVPVGVKLCWRSPPPYQELYSLQECGPPLNELTQVRRGDPRCDRYEDRN
jgi:hypothetical protein